MVAVFRAKERLVQHIVAAPGALACLNFRWCCSSWHPHRDRYCFLLFIRGLRCVQTAMASLAPHFFNVARCVPRAHGRAGGVGSGSAIITSQNLLRCFSSRSMKSRAACAVCAGNAVGILSGHLCIVRKPCAAPVCLAAAALCASGSGALPSCFMKACCTLASFFRNPLGNFVAKRPWQEWGPRLPGPWACLSCSAASRQGFRV